MEAQTTAPSVLVSTMDFANVFPEFDFNRDTFVGEFKNFGTAQKPIAICLSNLFHPVKPFIFTSQVKFCNPNFVNNACENKYVEDEYIYPDNYKLIGIQSSGRVYIPKEHAHKLLGEWWLSTVWPRIEHVPGLTKYSAFHRFNGVEMDKYIPGWTNNWRFFSRDVCEIMNF